MESIGGVPWVSDWVPLVLKRVPRFHVWGLWVLGGIPWVPSGISQRWLKTKFLSPQKFWFSISISIFWGYWYWFWYWFWVLKNFDIDFDIEGGKILILILVLILKKFFEEFWYWYWFWKPNFWKYWYWYWTKIWYCAMSDEHLLNPCSLFTRAGSITVTVIELPITLQLLL